MINPFIKHLLGFSSKENDDKVRREWNKRTKNICKPCWELKYCPYGPLVEDFPLLGPTRKEAIEHNDFLKEQLEKKAYKGWRKKLFTKEVTEFNSKDYPTKHDKKDIEKSCSVFGHMCPVFFVNEPFTETKEKRRIGRQIPRHIIIRVVLRDNNTCQKCGKILKDDKIEFDHI
ncbi:hypothetical protein GQ568_00415, partial [Patescibacteria group bacterium]|nr:hypothetical protein [Patescibacteria group bacterium]